MGHCRCCSSLMAIFDAENKRNLVVWVNPFSFFLVCLLPARCRRPPGGPPEGPPGGHYNQSYIIIIIHISLATVDNKKFCYTCTTMIKNTYTIDNWIIFWVPVLCSAYKLGFLFSPLLPFP